MKNPKAKHAAEANMAFLRSGALQPLAENRRGKTQHHDGERENPRELRLGPIAGNGLGYSYRLCERYLKNAESVDLTDAKVNRQCSGRH